jgi:hypothetical protein
MPSLSISIPHNLSSSDALQRIKNYLKKERAKHQGKIANLLEQWSGNVGTFSAKVMGFNMSGTILIKSNEVKVTGN